MSFAAAPGVTFLFATCQIGAELALKAEVARTCPDLRFAYSRAGFLTFKLPAGQSLPDDFDLGAVFGRAWGFSLGKATHENIVARATQVWEIAGPRTYDCLHVWQRDSAPAGDHRYEPGLDEPSRAAAAAIWQARPARLDAAPVSTNANSLSNKADRHRASKSLGGNSTGRLEASPLVQWPAKPGQTVLDCVLVEPHEWWVGYHRARGISSCWPGGFCEVALSAEPVSRAYLKIEEAIAWSALPVKPGDHVVEIGCAPGGASQALLERGLIVTGIDPADVDPRVSAHPRFTHVRKRGADVRRREFRGVRWLIADMNVAPSYTLTTVEEIVRHPSVHIEGMLLTLKLIDWHLAEEVPVYLDRIRSWGFAHVAARQLSHNRQEICVAARRKR